LLHALDNLCIDKCHGAFADADKIGPVGIAAQKDRFLLGKPFEIIDCLLLAPLLTEPIEHIVVLDIDDKLLPVLRLEQLLVSLGKIIAR
jgi:hypothetical protein